MEVVLGVQFQPLVGMHPGLLGAFWQGRRDKFPQVQQQPPLPHIVERKGGRILPFPMLQFFGPSEQPRLWLISGDNSELIQLQSDRFLRNWRRYHGPTIEYPSYDNHTRPNFESDFEELLAFVKAERLPQPVIDQCEITYINIILPCDVWRDFGDVSRVFNGLLCERRALKGAPITAVQWHTQHEISDSAGRFVGHLGFELDSAFAAPPGSPPSGELSPAFQLQITVRGRPLSEGVKGVMEFMDLGHAAIVKSFTEATTDEMHRAWGRTQ